MKVFKTAGMACSKDEYALLIAKIREREIETGERISVSKFLRDMVLPILNGHNPPTEQDTHQEIVSKSPEHTDSEQKNKSQKKKDLEIVSDNERDTDSDAPWENVKF